MSKCAPAFEENPKEKHACVADKNNLRQYLQDHQKQDLESLKICQSLGSWG